jgi:glyoxylase-like metal-dependent hydrolase (beta-lactamase superfamily II)
MMSTATAVGTEVADGIFEVQAPFWGYPLSLYFLQSGDRWAVVDTGVNTTPAEYIEPFMREHGGIQALELVLLTHGHVDHIGGNSALKHLAPQVRFAVHEADLGWAENVDRHFNQLYTFGEPEAWTPDEATEQAVRAGCASAVAIDHILADGDVISLGRGRTVEVTHVGGHSPGEVLLRDRQTGAVFCGDALQGAGAMNSQSGKRDFPMYRTVRQYLAALDRVGSLEPEVLCTAHQRAFTGDAISGAIEKSRRWTEGFTEELTGILREAGSLTLSEAVAAVSAARPEHAVSLQIHVTTAEHLNELIRGGVARPSIDEGVKRWSWNR